MTRWLRLYADTLDNPKVQRLPPAVFKAWVNLLCLAAKNDGRLPGIADIAFALRMPDGEADVLVQSLIAARLLDDEPEGLMPHDWRERQFVSDRDPTAAERQRRKREKAREGQEPKGNSDGERSVTRDKAVTSHRPEQRQIQIQSRTERAREAARVAPPAPSSRIGFQEKGFPPDGTIAFSQWETLVRRKAPGVDVDLAAQRFRSFCAERRIRLDAPNVAQIAETFFAKLRPVYA